MFTKLITGIQAERSILVIDLFLCRITQNAVSMVYFLELNINNRQSTTMQSQLLICQNHVV